MCGRYRLAGPKRFAEFSQVRLGGEFLPRFNITPTQGVASFPRPGGGTVLCLQATGRWRRSRFFDRLPETTIMCYRFFAFLIFLTASSVIRAEQQNEGASPDGEIRYEARSIGQNLESGAEKAIWLSERGSEDWVKLCETPGWGSLEMHFSPDSHWLMVQDGGASLGISLRVFEQKNGAHYRELIDRHLDDRVERLAMDRARAPRDWVSDHRYLRVLAWSHDSSTVLLRLSGHGGGPFSMRGWVTLYDVKADTFSFDLDRMNEGAIRKGR